MFFFYFAAALAAALRWLCRCIWSIFYSLCRSATVGFIVLSKEPFSRATTRQIAHERLWLLQLHVNYNFIESIWCIIFCHRAHAVSQWTQREDSPTAHSNYYLSAFFYFQPHTFMDFQFFHQQ
jgi:hypothetical protein